MTAAPGEPVDVRNNPESRAAERDGSTSVSRASDGGAIPRNAPEAGELPDREAGGTSAGNPVSGVTISEGDRDRAVSGDTRESEPGR